MFKSLAVIFILMKAFIQIFLVLSLIFPIQEKNNCEKYNSEYVPIDLIDAIDYLECMWSKNAKKKFSELPEKEAVSSLHFTTGLAIRNSWDLWNNKNSLVKFFNSKGIFHADDISSIILTSFHRHLNNKEIQFESQVTFFKAYWNAIKENENKKNEIALQIYNRHKISDSISIYFEIDSSSFLKDFAHKSIESSLFDPKKDLKIEAILLEKKEITDSSDINFLIKICKLNRIGKVNTRLGEIQVQDTVEIDLKYLIIE